MAAPEHIRKIYGSVEAVKRLSDRVVGVGRFGIGIDGLLAFVPGAGGLYGLGAGAFLVAQGVRAGAEPLTLLKMTAYLLADSAVGAVPLAGDAVDLFFRAHLMAANELQKDIEKRHGPIGEPDPAGAGLKKVGEGSVAGAKRS